jgi:threonylcarbamoyladenosine tRNA methylthiotransferase MtaB
MNGNHNRRIAFKTIGCRLNQYETERMAADLNPFGLNRVKPGEPADVFIINTCTVTHKADKDCRYYIRRARRVNPDCKVVVVGCYVEHDAARLKAMEQVDVLVYNDQKQTIADILQNRLPNIFTPPDPLSCSRSPDPVARSIRNRAWIKISDGCNQTCSFCLVTKVRGKLINRSADELLSEIHDLIRQGFHEVVLTGVNIGYYKDLTADPPIRDLAEFCRRTITQTGLTRLRLSSIEPQTVSESLITLAAENSGLCRYFHIPAQSGSSRILRLMKRPYTRSQYLHRLEMIKKADHGITVGADIIVGFPGESGDDFAESCAVADSGLIDYLHVFSYSDRPRTAAFDMPGKVPPEVIKHRHDYLQAISVRRWQQTLTRQVGRTLQVIAEHRQAPDGSRMAVADNYVRVRLPHGINPGRTPVTINVTTACDGYVDGDLSTP